MIKRGSIDSVKAQPCVVFFFKLIWTFFPERLSLKSQYNFPLTKLLGYVSRINTKFLFGTSENGPRSNRIGVIGAECT